MRRAHLQPQRHLSSLEDGDQLLLTPLPCRPPTQPASSDEDNTELLSLPPPCHQLPSPLPCSDEESESLPPTQLPCHQPPSPSPCSDEESEVFPPSQPPCSRMPSPPPFNDQEEEELSHFTFPAAPAVEVVDDDVDDPQPSTSSGTRKRAVVHDLLDSSDEDTSEFFTPTQVC